MLKSDVSTFGNLETPHSTHLGLTSAKVLLRNVMIMIMINDYTCIYKSSTFK